MPLVNATLFGIDFELEYLVIERDNERDGIHYFFWIHEEDEKKFLENDQEREKIIQKMMNNKTSRKYIFNLKLYNDIIIINKTRATKQKYRRIMNITTHHFLE